MSSSLSLQNHLYELRVFYKDQDDCPEEHQHSMSWWWHTPERWHSVPVASVRPSDCGEYLEITTVEPEQLNVGWGPTHPTRHFQLDGDRLLVRFEGKLYGSTERSGWRIIPARLQLQ